MKSPDVPNRLVENALEVALRERRAFQVLLCLDLLGDHDSLLILNGRHFLLPQRLLGAFVVPQVQLCANEYDGYAGRMMVDFWVPLPCSARVKI